jgi:hypothetical protein
VSTYTSPEQILAQKQATAAAEATAATEPETLTIEQVNTLPGETISRLMAENKLVHLNMGGRTKPPRRSR